MTRAALRHLKPGSSIINATSEAAYHGEPNLLDYSASMGAVVALTRSLAVSLIDRKVRVNAVASGPPWLSMVPAGMDEEESAEETDVPHRRTGQPEDIAPTYVFLASADAAYMTGEILHPNSGEYAAS
jgi:NAD(P)-dependent dehydrogenase (short-subunit alcohol dehydrogenase family)